MTVGLTKPVHIEDRVLYEWFDNAHQHTILFIDGQIFMLEFNELEPTMKLLYNIEEIPPQILLCKISLDKEILAIQTSDNSVTILDIAFRRKWTIQPRFGEDAGILPGGILWSEHGGSSQDLILITSKGLELYKVSSKKGVCKLSRAITLPISHFWYNPDCRMLLTATQNKPVKRFLGGTTPVTKDTLLVDGFFLNVEKSNIPSLELPPPDRITRLELGPGVDSNRIYLVHVYGLLLSLVQYTTEEGDFVTVYHVTKTSMEKMATLSLGYNPQQILKVSTYDNLLLFHDVSMKITIAFDLMKPPRKATASTTGVIDPVIKPIIATFAYVPRDEVQVGSPSRIRAKTVSAAYATPSIRDAHTLKFITSGDARQISRQLPSPSRKGFIEVENRLEAYPFYSPVVFDIHISGWAYDCERRIMWKIECNPFHVAQQISDPWERMAFLYRRGKVIHWIGDDPSPIVASSGYESMMAISSVLQMVLHALDRKVSDRELMTVFRAMHMPYWNEAHRLKSIYGSSAGFVSGNRVIDSDLNDALLVPVYRKQESSYSTTNNSSSTNSNRFPNSPSSDSLATQKLSLRSLRRPLRDSLTKLRKSDNAVEVEIDVSEPLEPVGTSQLFLPDISVIGIKVRNIALKNLETMKFNLSASNESARVATAGVASVIEGIESLGVRSPSPPIINMALEQKPITIRRDEKGDLVISQHDMLAYVWLPLLATEHEVPYAYYADCLSTYITALAEMDLEVIPAVNILHTTLLFYLGRLQELCNLLRNGFYNDSSELALMLLQFSDMLDDEVKSADYVLKYSHSLLHMNHDLYHYHLPTWRDLLQRQGMDMLWRRQEKVMVVKWLLTQCRVTEAFSLCLPKNDRWDDILRPGCIPGSEFFISAMNVLKLQQGGATSSSGSITGNADTTSRDKNLSAETRRLETNAQLFYNLHYFLTIWDPRSLLTADKLVVGVTPLCNYAPFPANAFTEAVEKDIRRLFGYAK